jgi:hypothetical protein
MKDEMKDEMKNKGSRRNFLVKTSAVSLISALPATSAWGACTVSGALSGGSKVNGDCAVTIQLSGGCNPRKWKEMTNCTNIDSYFQCLKDLKPNFQNNNTQAKRDKNALKQEYFDCETNHLHALIVAAQEKSFILGKDEKGNTFSIYIKDALQAGGIGAKLAAVYLNSYFEFYPDYTKILPSGDIIDNDEKLLKHLFGLFHANGNPSSSYQYYGFNTTRTNYAPVAASSCTKNW